MAKLTSNTRERMLLLRDMLAESDAAHPIPLSQIISRLASTGLSVTRKSLYRDLAALKRSSLQIRYRHQDPKGWYAAGDLSPHQEPRQVLGCICSALHTQHALAVRLGQEERPCLVSPSGVMWMGKHILFFGNDIHTNEIKVIPLEKMERVVVSGYPCSASLGQQSSGK